jgi:ABC-type antimicrobial peptide transport system permease subunit
MRQKEVAVIVLLFVLLAAGNTFAQDEALSSVGALGAGYMYTTYLSVGAIADGHYYEVYDDETTVQLLEEIKSLADATSESLQELLESDTITIDDFNFINEMITTLGLLYKEAENYQNYVQTGEERYATVYDNYRNNAWAKITDLLGIEE